MKELKQGNGIDVVILKLGNEKFSLKGNYYDLWNELKINHYNKTIASKLNLPEPTCLRMIRTLLANKLIESKMSTELDINNVPNDIKELIKNKDLRITFYFNKAKEIKMNQTTK